MPLGAARIALLAKTQIQAVAEVYRPQVGVTAVGNAQIDTAQSQFGGSSALFDGTDDYLITSQSDSLSFSGDFTIEAWTRSASTGTIISNRTVDATGFDTGTFTIERRSDDILRLTLYDSANIDSSATSDNTWFHWAIVRSSGTITLYLDGTSQGTSSNTATIGSGSHNQIQLGCLGAALADFNGHIDEFRVSDTARYTTSFTPSTTPFENDANTVLLLHMDGTDGSTRFIDDNGTWDDAIEEGGYYFTGATDYSSFTSDPAEFTVSFWAKMGSGQGGDMYVMQLINEKSGGASNAMLVRFEENGDLEIYYQSGYRYNFNVSDMHRITGDNAWHHFVFSVDTVGETNKLYIDGADSTESASTTTANPDMTQVLKLGLGATASSSAPIGTGSGVAQVGMWDVYYDLSTDISKFYDNGPVDMGTDGTASGLAAPFLYHYGNTDTFDTNNGRTTGESLSYPTLTSVSSPTDSFIPT